MKVHIFYFPKSIALVLKFLECFVITQMGITSIFTWTTSCKFIQVVETKSLPVNGAKSWGQWCTREIIKLEHPACKKILFIIYQTFQPMTSALCYNICCASPVKVSMLWLAGFNLFWSIHQWNVDAGHWSSCGLSFSTSSELSSQQCSIICLLYYWPPQTPLPPSMYTMRGSAPLSG